MRKHLEGRINLNINYTTILKLKTKNMLLSYLNHSGFIPGLFKI